MLDTLTDWLADPITRGWYLAFCVALMVVPMFALAIWYHSRVGRGEGGRALMRRQAGSRPSHSRPHLSAGVEIARDIQAGRYGKRAKAMQRIVYWVCGIWVAALVGFVGLLIYADEVNRGRLSVSAASAPEKSAEAFAPASYISAIHGYRSVSLPA